MPVSRSSRALAPIALATILAAPAALLTALPVAAAGALTVGSTLSAWIEPKASTLVNEVEKSMSAIT